ncbi:MAG: hypothetical protein IK025_03380 [Bacteroidales bacterium]|nr:hypothetical protein [Bacteroidales bacterium]
MKKFLVAVIIAIISISAVSAQSMDIILHDGKYNKMWGEVTYNTIIEKYDSYGRLTYLECAGKGDEPCPISLPYIQEESSFEKAIQNATVNMEVQILNDLKAGKDRGEFKYKYITLSYKNAKLATNESGAEELQYDWSITDFRTVRDVKDIMKYKEALDRQKE